MSTVNVSKVKREELKKKIEELKIALIQSNVNNTEKLISYLGQLEDELIKKRFGLIFEEHKEEVDFLLENNHPILVENKELAITNGKPLIYY